MTDERSDTGLHNRRFLVSLWPPSVQAPEAGDFETLRGMVWEADPRDPGRIAAPASFVGLAALPRVLGGFLRGDGAPTPSEGQGDDA